MLIDFSACNNNHLIVNNYDIAQGRGLMCVKPSNTQGSSHTRSRQRRRISSIKSPCLLFFFAATILLSLLPGAIEGKAPGTRWLQHRLRQIAAAHFERLSPPLEAPATQTPLDQDVTESSTPLVVVATHEGQVWTIDSRDGNVVAGFSTGPPLLVIDDHYNAESTDDDGDPQPPIPTGLTQSQIVPSMDGILYWRQPILSTPGDDNESSSSSGSSSNTRLVPIASIRDLVDNPIQICHEVDGENCDILTATSLGPSLFSLNSQGSLNWARARSSNSAATTSSVKPVPLQRKTSTSESIEDETDDDDDTDSSESDGESDNDSTANSSTSSGSKTSLLLQRQDYLVQQISTETGEQIWNITWGSLEAIDFLGQSSDDGATGAGATSKRPCRSGCPIQNIHYLPSGESTPTSSLPSLIFANQGKSLVAVWTQPPKFLWKRDFISVVTNVLGIERDSWQPVNVVLENDGWEDDDSRHSSHRPNMHPRLPAYEHSSQRQQEEIDRWYWFWAGGSSGLGKTSKALDIDMQFFIHPQAENGLVFVPRPNAHHLVRNSWYLNHYWDTPQSRGAQSFQGYLADRPHKEGGQHYSSSSQERGQPQTKQRRVSNPPRSMDDIFDTSRMPRLLLLPPTEHPNLGLASPMNPGGVFLSWSVVVAIVTLLAGTAGAAYVIYGQKKRKWMARSDEKVINGSGSGINQGAAELSCATVSISPYTSRERSISTGNDISKSRSRALSQSHDGQCNGIDSNLLGTTKPSKPFLGNARKLILSRSSSAPIMTRDDFDCQSNQSFLGSAIHSRELSPNKRVSAPPIQRKDEKTRIVPGQLTKHKSAPVDSPFVPQGGIDMIDGIPLIRYSRYQSEFRELEPLGRGGFGTVFRVANVLDGREYAVKKVSIRSSDWNSPGTEAFSQELHRVLREVKFLALLDHPSIVRYYTAWLEMEENNGNTVVDENVNSKTLSRRFSSELLTGLDPSFNTNAESQTNPSLRGHKPSSSIRTPIHLKSRNATNPLGWNNDIGNFDESSASAYYPKHSKPVLPSMEDCGFIFEEGSDEEGGDEPPLFIGNQMNGFRQRSAASSECSKSEHSVSSSWDASYSLNRRKKKGTPTIEARDKEKKAGSERRERSNSKSSRHTLYIQMQLCSSKTLADFLANKEARRGPAAAHTSSSSSGTVDIPCALRLFLQIVQAVHHVHQQGLIHRDLKPSNCFIDETGTVKVGDFGLSRESNDNNENSESPSLILDEEQDNDGAGDNTVGVGTRSYASPEQMNGSDYDSKTDIYALGVMLFELLYPMYTGMERHICFQRLRSSGTFPEGWRSTVSAPFPTLNELVRSMLSLKPKDRPTADKVARHIQSLLEEHSVTLNISHHDGDNENVIFVRVEAKPVPDVLKSAIQFIHDAASPQTVDIVQYGMRSSTKSTSKEADENPQKRAILEFALSSADVDPTELASWGSSLVAKLVEHDEVLVARHVWHQNTQSYWSSRNSMH